MRLSVVTDERRREPRFPFKIPAHVQLGTAEQLCRGYVVNLSDSGLLASMSDGIVEVGNSVHVQFVLRPDTECVASGRIIHVLPLENGQTFGADLTECNENYAHFMGELASASKRETMAFVNRIVRIVIRVSG